MCDGACPHQQVTEIPKEKVEKARKKVSFELRIENIYREQFYIDVCTYVLIYSTIKIHYCMLYINTFKNILNDIVLSARNYRYRIVKDIATNLYHDHVQLDFLLHEFTGYMHAHAISLFVFFFKIICTFFSL